MEQEKNNNEVANRLIIVGNGYDLALGLKTSYHDFMLWLLKKGIIEFVEEFDCKHYENPIFQIQPTLSNRPPFLKDYKKELKNLSDFTSIIWKFQHVHKVIISPEKGFPESLIYECSNKKWVDIESLYFERMESLFGRIQNNLTKGELSGISSLNSQMEYLRVKLLDYIREQQSVFSKNLEKSKYDKQESFIRSFEENLSKTKNVQVPIVMFLNFNYTNTIKPFFDISEFGKHLKFKEISIHGSTIEADNNPIIFGYGDDTSKAYKEMELHQESTLRRYIKSFYYPDTHNYHNLLNFLNTDKYEVCIIGHSCGLSDKTLLKTIFEHENCISLKAYHYNGRNDHFNKRLEVSRHFDDKAKMRERLLPFDESAKIPQYINETPKNESK